MQDHRVFLRSHKGPNLLRLCGSDECGLASPKDEGGGLDLENATGFRGPFCDIVSASDFASNSLDIRLLIGSQMLL